MNWTDLAAAFALFLVLEGLVPFASPRTWREAVKQLSSQPESAIRRMGLVCMISGVVLLYLIRGGS